MELLAGAGYEGMEKQLRAWHSLQASEADTDRVVPAEVKLLPILT